MSVLFVLITFGGHSVEFVVHQCSGCSLCDHNLAGLCLSSCRCTFFFLHLVIFCWSNSTESFFFTHFWDRAKDAGWPCYFGPRGFQACYATHYVVDWSCYMLHVGMLQVRRLFTEVNLISCRQKTKVTTFSLA